MLFQDQTKLLVLKSYITSLTDVAEFHDAQHELVKNDLKLERTKKPNRIIQNQKENQRKKDCYDDKC